MQKVMLVIDDYSEVVFQENLLKRMGFDVLSLNRDTAFTESLLSFFPDLMIATLKGRHVEGLRLAIALKKKSANSKAIMLIPAGQNITLPPEARVDSIIETPIQALPFLKEISRLLKLDEAQIVQKFEKLSKAMNFNRDPDMKFAKEEKAQDNQFVKGGAGPAAQPAASGSGSGMNSVMGTGPAFGGPARPQSQREKRYAEFLAKHGDPVDQVLPPVRLNEAIKDAKAAEKKASTADAKLLDQKREFVKALMKNAKAK